ncbi:hypothetical protein [Kitasatospora cineracea]|uniref:Uncharacterized protein n=1 Tax=Kitasatospora cineracea TaxID=88074 RepID=A0A8G1UA04_9ACTN|nr:hypothetical protein [Kitasatospora cineracea]ROR35600.1 hypothetical protein EDD39_7261 [Kitasatospora cineracea]
MKRPALAAATAALATGALLTGCGSTHAPSDQAGAARPAVSASPSVSASASGSAGSTPEEAQRKFEEQRKQAAAEHDRTFPAVAAACAGKSTATPSPAATATASGGYQPENPKYNENHVYAQLVPLNPLQQCRGDAHAARVTAEVAKQPPTGPDQAKALLTRLGYPGAAVGQTTNGVQFSVSVPGVGPCLSGTLSATPRVEAHGPYLEGGCERPKGGH